MRFPNPYVDWAQLRLAEWAVGLQDEDRGRGIECIDFH